jgi:hypothetical protein
MLLKLFRAIANELRQRQRGLNGSGAVSNSPAQRLVSRTNGRKKTAQSKLSGFCDRRSRGGLHRLDLLI